MLRMTISILVGVLGFGCAPQSDVASELQTSQAVAFAPTPLKITFEQCQQDQEACLNRLAKIDPEEASLLQLAFQESDVMLKFAAIKDVVTREIAQAKEYEAVANCFKNAHSLTDRNNCESRLPQPLPGAKPEDMLARMSQTHASRVGHETLAVVAAYQDFENLLRTRSLSELTCAAETGDGIVSDFAYYFCKEFKFIAALRTYADQQRTYADYFADSESEAYLRYERKGALIDRLADEYQSKVMNFVGWANIYYAAYTDGTLTQVKPSVVSTFTLHVDPESWLALTKQYANAFGKVIADTMLARGRYLVVQEKLIDREIDSLNHQYRVHQQELTAQKASKLIQSKNLEIEHFTEQTSSIEREIAQARQRLARDYRALIPIANDGDGKGFTRHLPVAQLSDLAFNESPDLAFASGEATSGNVINLRLNGGSARKVKITVPSSVEIVANGVYRNLAAYQRDFHRYNVYVTCFTMRYKKMASRNKLQWSLLCEKERSYYGLPMNPHSGKGVLGSGWVGPIYRFCPSQGGLCVDEDLTAKWRMNPQWALRDLEAIFLQEERTFLAFKAAMSDSTYHRAGDQASLEGYVINVNEGKSWGQSSGTSNSFGTSVGASGNGISVGYSGSKSSSSGTSEGSGRSAGRRVGFFHENAVSQDFVLGMLLAQCLDESGQTVPNGDLKFFGVGTNSVFSLPEGCSYLQLFVNDDPTGMSANTCQPPDDVPGDPNVFAIGHWVDHRNFYFGRIATADPDNLNKPFINNNQGECSWLSKNFLISVDVIQNFNDQAAAIMAMVSDEKLESLLGKDIFQNDNAYQEARAAFVQQLNQMVTDPELVSRAMAYVEQWVSVQRLRAKKSQASMQIAVLALESKALALDLDLDGTIADLYQGIDQKINDKLLLAQLEHGFVAKLVRSYERFADYYLFDLLAILDQYQESLNYHRPELDLPSLRKLESLKKTLSAMVKKRLFSQLSVADSGINTVATTPEVREELQAIEAALANDLSNVDVNLRLGDLILEQDFVGTIYNRVTFESIEHCAAELFVNFSIPGMPVATGTGGWRGEVHAVPMLVTAANGEQGINPEFDAEKACFAFGPATAGYSQCLASLRLVQDAIASGAGAGDFGQLLVTGYDEIRFAANFSEQDSCLKSNISTVPQYVVAGLEFSSMRSVIDPNRFPKALPIQVSQISDWHGSQSHYATYVAANGPRYLSEKVFGEANFNRQRINSLKLRYKGNLQGCYNAAGVPDFDKQACFQELAGYTSDQSYALGPLSHLRPDTDFMVILPHTDDDHRDGVLALYHNLRQEASFIKLHGYFLVRNRH